MESDFNVRSYVINILNCFQLGVALGFNLQFDEAVNALNDAIGVLQKRIDNLKTESESKGNFFTGLN